jgi:ribonuclease HI
MEIAVVALGLTTVLPDVGYGTSSDAEWLALIHALTVAKSIRLPVFILLGDAADVVAKANGMAGRMRNISSASASLRLRPMLRECATSSGRRTLRGSP